MTRAICKYSLQFLLLQASLAAAPAFAGQLKVEPVLIELNAPSVAATLNLRNEGEPAVTVQTRVMRWTQIDGREILEPATGVVASPPFANLAPGADYVVRVVRTAKTPVQGEESYRVFVDQLPNPRNRQSRAVNLLIRQSLPAFFRATELSPPRVEWRYSIEGGAIHIHGTNAGDERLRIASLRVRDRAGATISYGNGLIGYVLGRSSISWKGPAASPGFGAGGPLTVTATTDKGPLNAVALPRDR